MSSPSNEMTILDILGYDLCLEALDLLMRSCQKASVYLQEQKRQKQILRVPGKPYAVARFSCEEE